MLWRMAWREIRYDKVFTFLFVLNVAIGLLGLVTIENFKVSFQSVLNQRAKNLLGADIALSSRFPLSPDKRAIFNKAIKSKESSQIDLMTMFSMARSEKTNRLIYLHTLSKGEGELYPFYGHIELDKEIKFPRDSKKLPGSFKLWAYPEVESQLGSRRLKIGDKDFLIESIVTDDSQQTFEMGSVAPKVFLRLEDAKAAGLIKKGSTIRYYTLAKTDVPITEELVKNLTEELDDTAIKVRTPKQSSQQVGRVLAYLSDFLGLVSLVALFLASVGLFYLYRSHLGGKRISFAIYSSVGLSSRSIFGIYIRHVLILGVLGSFFGLGLSAIVIPLINLLLAKILPFALPAIISPRALSIGLLVGLVGVLLLSYPLILGAIRQKTASLFQEVAEIEDNAPRGQRLHFLPYLIFFSAMTLYAANSFKVGGTFLLLFFGVTLLTFPLGLFLLKMGEKLSHSVPLGLKLSLRYLNRYRISTISIFLSLLLGSMLLNLIPLLQQSIQAEISMGKEASLPSLFLFDIQDEQVSELASFFKEEQEINLLALSPFIRSRIKKINGQDVKVETEKALTREEEREQRFRNRGTNLSYRDELTESETLVEGKVFPGRFIEGKQKYPYVSIEVGYAGRMGIELGDLVTFDILGVPIVAEVFNLRKVRWTSFLPNFFIQFQSGVLNDAPKTWLAAVPFLGADKKESVQSLLYNKFPNVSAVDISRLVKKILDVMGQMGWALKAMSFLCLVVGFFVLYSLANHQMEGRKADLVLLKVIGMKQGDLRKMVTREFVSIGLLAAVIGAAFGLIVSFIVTNLFFDGLWSFNLMWPIISIITITGLCWVTATFATKKALKVKASYFLN
jgi:putative ABC transport system permease protein